MRAGACRCIDSGVPCGHPETCITICTASRVDGESSNGLTATSELKEAKQMRGCNSYFSKSHQCFGTAHPAHLFRLLELGGHREAVRRLPIDSGAGADGYACLGMSTGHTRIDAPACTGTHRALERSHRFCDICRRSRRQVDPADHVLNRRQT